MGIRTSSHIAKMVHAHNAKDDNRKVVRFPGIQEPPPHYGLLMIRGIMESFPLFPRLELTRRDSCFPVLRELAVKLLPEIGVSRQMLGFSPPR